jgi:hypothetical protein
MICYSNSYLNKKQIQTENVKSTTKIQFMSNFFLTWQTSLLHGKLLSYMAKCGFLAPIGGIRLLSSPKWDGGEPVDG